MAKLKDDFRVGMVSKHHSNTVVFETGTGESLVFQGATQIRFHRGQLIQYLLHETRRYKGKPRVMAVVPLKLKLEGELPKE